MPCPLCGDICRCSSNAHSAASARDLSDPGEPSVTATPGEDGNESADNSPPWRQEVAARLNRYQARRKPRPPRYPSLRLRFDEEVSVPAASGIPDEFQAFPQRITTGSNQALALDEFAGSAIHTVEIPASTPVASPEDQVPDQTAAFPPSESPQRQTTDGTPLPVTAPATAKIIEFPRSWAPPLAPLDELAGPVLDRDRPRILEAPEVAPPPPALGGITIEPAQLAEIEKRPGIDIPLQSAPLARRISSAAIDGIIVAGACALFGIIFWKLTAILPPRIQMIGIVAALFAVFWAAYQYLLVVYSGTTPGLLLSRLELVRFDGSHASRRLRRWRVVASFLSAASLGMGYAWVFLDEDSLCWHDRITHTHLAPGAVRQQS